MYYYIKGTLVHKDDNFIVVDAGGVGYKIYTSNTSIMSAGETGREIIVYTYLHIREDVMDLYGFIGMEEKNMFLHLMSVSGVGPKAALAVLSVADSARIAVAIVTNDVKTITKAAGVGPKMAQRIILELKDKIDADELNISYDGAEEVPADNINEAVSALVVLGYSPQDAKNAVRGIDGSLSVEEIIKKALVSLF